MCKLNLNLLFSHHVNKSLKKVYNVPLSVRVLKKDHLLTADRSTKWHNLFGMILAKITKFTNETTLWSRHLLYGNWPNRYTSLCTKWYKCIRRTDVCHSKRVETRQIASKKRQMNLIKLYLYKGILYSHKKSCLCDDLKKLSRYIYINLKKKEQGALLCVQLYHHLYFYGKICQCISVYTRLVHSTSVLTSKCAVLYCRNYEDKNDISLISLQLLSWMGF